MNKTNNKTKDDRILDYICIFGEHKPFSNDEILQKLDDVNFFTAPASIGHHGNYEGGLFDHSLNVTNTLLNFTIQFNLKWSFDISPIVIGMFHDLCKCDNYVIVPDEVETWKPIDEETKSRINSYKWAYNPQMDMPGHGDKSIIIGDFLGIKFTSEEIACIRWHMGAFDDKENWQYYTRAVQKNPNVLWTHTADMYASQVLEV